MPHSIVESTPGPLAQPLVPEAPPLQYYEDEVRLGSYLDTLREGRWLIAKIAGAFLLGGLAYAFITPPVYETTMLLHVEEDMPNNNARNMIGEISALFDIKAAAISEMELIKSRMVLSNAIDRLGLYIDARPVYMPVVGPLVARYTTGLSTPGIFGYGGYAWGDESIDVSSFYVPESLHNKQFMLTVLEGRRFAVQQAESGINFTGAYDKPLTLNLRDGQLKLHIKDINARPGAKFTLTYRPKLDTIERVQKALTVAEIGKQSGLVRVSYEGPDAKLVYDTLSEITREYVHQNVTRKLEEAEKSLAFLDKQMPLVKQQLDDSEAEYYRFRRNSGTIDISEESKISLQQAAAAKTRMLELQQKRQELLASFTPNHPVVQAVDQQIRAMNAEVERASAHIRQLPNQEHELLRLNREVKTNTDLYAALLASAQQLRLVKAGKVSNVRLVDTPILPSKPARPERGKITGLAFGVGLFLGLVAVFLRKVLRRGLESPRKVEQLLGARVVYATVPHSKAQEDSDRAVAQGKRAPELLARIDPLDPAVESLRSFRAALQAGLERYRNNVVALCSPTPGVGRSFIAANFAAVQAAAGQRVLLVDADLRAAHLSAGLGLAAGPGLAEAISGSAPIDHALRREVMPGLDVMPAGALPPNPAEFLLHPSFAGLLGNLSARYDLVLVSTPPLLAVADGLSVARHAGSVFVVARARLTTDDDLNDAIQRLNRAGVAPQGVLFNDMRAASGANAIHAPRSGLLLPHRA